MQIKFYHHSVSIPNEYDDLSIMLRKCCVLRCGMLSISAGIEIKLSFTLLKRLEYGQVKEQKQSALVK